MVFSSVLFLFFFLTVVLGVYYLLPRKARNGWLFFSSILFYGYGEPVYVLLFLGSITFNYLCGLCIGKFPLRKKLTLILCIAGNLLLLGFFKYTPLVVGTLRSLPVFSFLPMPEIALPIGISFYTFQAMSYVIDAYRGNCAVQKNYLIFGTYVSLFPQLIAGPIVRYVDVEAQLMGRQETREQFDRGVKLFTVGLAKKVLLANAMGQYWNGIKALGASAGFFGTWLGVLAFTLQIYFDFSGYSDMARGIGNLFGFSFVENFHYPYISRSITEFWRRWHISLGTWFREYVYIPLGGNRKGKARLLLNLLIVWGLTGLWHGASWNFVLWGLYFGLLLIIEKFFLLKKLEKAPAFLTHIYALFFILLGWVLFDFTDMGQMGAFLSGMFTFGNGAISAQAAYLAISYAPLTAVAIFACLPFGKQIYQRIAATRFGWAFDCAAVSAVLILATAALVSSTYNPFLYFRF